MSDGGTTIEYKDTLEKKYRARIHALLVELPPYCRDFSRFLKTRCVLHTCMQYLNDVYTFYRFLAENNPMIKTIGIRSVDLDTLENLSGDDFDEYLNWLSAYKFDAENENEVEKRNKNSTKKRKMISLRTFFKYLYVRDKISRNPIEKAVMPRADKKLTTSIRILSDHELELFLNCFDNAYEAAQDSVFSASDEEFKKDPYLRMRPAMIKRDQAIVYLILNTGLRVSEVCAINCADIGWNTGKINVIRKEDEDGGEKESYVCVNEEMLSMLNEYIEDARPLLNPNPANYDALFIGNKKSRIMPRSIERIVKKYATQALGAKNGITPHKLRATFGSMYYRKTQDITATALALNHLSGIEVAAKYYLHPADDALERAAMLNLTKSAENSTTS